MSQSGAPLSGGPTRALLGLFLALILHNPGGAVNYPRLTMLEVKSV